MKVLKKILQYKYFPVILLAFAVIISLFRINNFKIVNNSFIEAQFKITNVKYQNNQFVVELENKEKYICYLKEFSYNIGDIVKVKGNLENVPNNTFFNNFNYKDYLKIRGIFYELKINDMELVKKNKNILIEAKKWLINTIEKNNNKDFLYTFILGDTTFIESKIKNQFYCNGLSYIFVLGSFKIMIITKMLELIKRKLRLKEKPYLIIVSFILFLYFYLVNMKIGIVKAGLVYLLRRIFYYQRLKIKTYNIIFLVASILLLMNPFNIINSAFYYSFIIGLGLSLKVKKYHCYWKRTLIFSVKCFLLSLPLNIYYNYEINFFTIFFSILILPLIYYIIFPLSLLSFILPFLSNMLDFFLSFLLDLNSFFSSVSLLTFVFKKPNVIIIILYYSFVLLVFMNKKYIILFFILLFVHFNINKIIPSSMVLFFDVKQGDSILLKNNDNTTLIDTGGSLYYDFEKSIIKTLKSFGISTINNLIITHGDYDHMGEAINLVNNFKVEKVIFNCGPYNELEKELIKVLEKKQIKYYSCIKELNIDNNKLYFLQTKVYDNENDNSNVIYTEINGYKFMFMGDASSTTEKEIIDKYNLPDIDVLKVGHHGSKTSSNEEFISEINPKYSIISVGKNNRYGHPNKEVLENLKDSEIYRTDKDGSVMFKIKNNKLKIETCSP